MIAQTTEDVKEVSGMESMGQRIKRRREALGLKPPDLAREIGVTSYALAKIESGETKDPKISTIRALSKALDVSGEWLLFGDEMRSIGPSVDELIREIVRLSPSSNGDPKADEQFLRLWRQVPREVKDLMMRQAETYLHLMHGYEAGRDDKRAEG